MEALIPKPTSPLGKLKPSEDMKPVLFVSLGSLVFFFGIIMLVNYAHHGPDITIPSMDFTVLNMTKPFSVKWDLSIWISPKHPGEYVCLEGDFKVFIVYEDVTIATSSIEESYTFIPSWRSKLLTASLTASLGDMDGAIVENIMDDIKAKGEIRFGARLLVPVCKSETIGNMNYACDDATLRFEPGSHKSATFSGNQPNCQYFI